MQIEIYVDVLFLINFAMIYFIFFIVNKLQKNKTSLKRLIFSSFFASLLYILTIIFIPYNKIFSIIIIFLIFALSIKTAFKPKNLKTFLKLFFITNIVAFCIGGLSMSLFYYTNFGNIVSFTLNHFPIKLLILSIIITYISLKLSINWYKKIVIKKQSFYNIVMDKNGKNISLNALLDTGNSLKEPITKKPVTIVEFDAIKNILPEKLKVIFYEKQEDNLEKLLELGSKADIRLIPFKSLGKENGLLIGIKIDTLNIDTYPPTIIKDAIVGIANFPLSNNAFYNAILNPELID